MQGGAGAEVSTGPAGSAEVEHDGIPTPKVSHPRSDDSGVSTDRSTIETDIDMFTGLPA